LPDFFINGTSACGDIIRDHHGGFIKNFLGSSLFAETWTLVWSQITAVKNLDIKNIISLDTLECAPR